MSFVGRSSSFSSPLQRPSSSLHPAEWKAGLVDLPDVTQNFRSATLGYPENKYPIQILSYFAHPNPWQHCQVKSRFRP